MMNNGFVIVASSNKKFLHFAQFLALSLKDNIDCSITLFTQDTWKDDPDNDIFDNIIGGAPSSPRAKLWALDKTPYDITCYLDADMVCYSENASSVFDLLGDNDIVFGKIEERCAAKIWWKRKEGFSVPHGGMFVWKNNEKMKSFMKQWWENWKTHQICKWRWGNKYDYRSAKFWDQFSLQIMLLDKEDQWYRPDIKWSWIKDHHIWNWIYAYDNLKDLNDRYKNNNIIFYHYAHIKSSHESN